MRDHRAERRRQDHLLQPDQRIFPADLRRHHFRRPRHHQARRRISASRSAWRGPSRSPRFSPNSRCSRTSASPPRSPADIGCGPGSTARKPRKSTGASRQTLKLVSLEAKTDRLVGELAHGDQRAAEIAMALALQPHLLLLDEPTAGMGDQETYQITQLIRRLHREQQLHHRADRARHARGVPSRRPHLRARPGPDAGARARRRRSPPTRPFRPPIWAMPHDRSPDSRRPSHLLRQEPYPAWRQPRGRRGQDHRAARTQRRRQDHDAAQPDGPDAGARGQDHDVRRRTPRAGRPSGSPRSGVGYVPEGRRIFANLSVEENLKVPLERGGPWTIERIYQLFPRLEERKLNRGRQLSGGEQEMLSIGRALLLNPQAADSRRAVAGPGAADRARGVPHRPADEGRRHFGAAGRAECADEPGNRRQRLCAGRRHRGLFGHRRANSPPTRRASGRSPAPAPRNGRSPERCAPGEGLRSLRRLRFPGTIDGL